MGRAKDALDAPLLRRPSAERYLQRLVFGAREAPSCYFPVLPGRARSPPVCANSAAAPAVQVTPSWQVEECLGAAAYVWQVAGDQGKRFPLRGNGAELMRIDTVETLWPLLSSGSHLAEQALDFLDYLEQNCLAEQDVDPRVKDGVERGEAYRSQVRVLFQHQLHWSLVELVQKDLSLQRAEDTNAWTRVFDMFKGGGKQ